MSVRFRRKRKKHRGLGDTIEAIARATGIKAVVHRVAGEKCGCEERREALNKILPYKA
jgi:hypothetical protein